MRCRLFLMILLNAACFSRSRRTVLALVNISPLRLGRGASSTSSTSNFAASLTTLSSSSSSSSVSEQEIAQLKEERKAQKQARKAAAKAKRKKRLLGVPKAVDMGQYATVYQPRPFVQKSGLPDRSRLFTVLGIESSCDDTGAAVVRSDGVILGEALASQDEIHAPWGGVVPGLARDAHEAQINAVVDQALQQAGLVTAADVDGIAVTVGPGLEICLRVGTTKARELAMKYNKPFCAVHHLEAHILMAGIMGSSSTTKEGEINDDTDHSTTVHWPATDTTHAATRRLDFPFLALLVSGGHCQLLHCQDVGRYDILGGTMDDSLGEALDKTARLLLGPGQGGADLEQWARRGDPQSVALPIPLRTRKNCNFSYAGLKTAARQAAQALVDERQGVDDILFLSDEDKANVAASFQNVAFSHIEQRLKYAMAQMEEAGVQTLAVVGGVAANQELRSRLDALCQTRDWRLVVPPPRYCTDQGAMSAWAGVERFWRGSSDEAGPQEVYARYPFAKLEDEESNGE